MFAFPSAVLVVCYLINDPTNEPDKRWNNNISDKNWTEMFAVWESFITTTLIFICFFYTVVQKHCVKNPYLLKYLSTMCFLYRSYVVDNQSDLSVLSWRNQNVWKCWKKSLQSPNWIVMENSPPSARFLITQRYFLYIC